jgi:predicted nucleotidyltransferase
VSDFEKSYKAAVFPTYVSNLKGEVDAMVAKLTAEAQALEASSSKRAAELAVMLKDLEENRIDRLTTVDEYAARNPDVDAEAMAAIKKGEYYA